MPIATNAGMELVSQTNGPTETELSLRLQVVKVRHNVNGRQGLELICLNKSSIHSQKSKQQTFSATPIDSQEEVRVYIEGVWCQTKFHKNCIIHLINPSLDNKSSHYIIDNKNGLLVVEPDNLYTCTLIASSLFCERKTWLNQIFLGQVGSNKAMTIGTLTHEVFQHAVRTKTVDISKLIAYLDDLLDDATVMLQIYSAETTLKEVRDEAIKYIPSIREWIEKFIFTGPPATLDNEPNLAVKMTKVVDIEENVWSTKYGLKGKIDVTGLVKVHDKRNNSVEEKTIPLELKTGNPNLSSSHAAQVSLYSMMIEDRYAKTNQGFVIYLKDRAAMHNVALTIHTKRDLVHRRNIMNHHLKDYSNGPDMLNQMRVCSNCERIQECILMSNMYNPTMLEENNVLKALEQDAISHLDQTFIAFFKRYHEKLVCLMTNTSSLTDAKPINDINVPSAASFWTRTSKESEDSGLGFGKLQASKSGDEEEGKYIIFKRHPDHEDNFIEVAQPAIVAALFKSATSTQSTNSSTTVKSPVPLITISSSGESQQPKPKRLKIDDYFKPKPKQTPTKPSPPKDSNKVVVDGLERQIEQVEIKSPPQIVAKTPITTSSIDKPKPRRKLKPFDKEGIDTARCRFAISLDNDKQNMDSLNSSTAIAIGFVNKLEEDHISMKIYEGNLDLKQTNLMYRIDKLEKKSTFDLERIVLIRLLEKSENCDKIRKFLVDSSYKPKENLDTNIYLSQHCYNEYSDNDAIEQNFILKSISTENYYVLNEKVTPNMFKARKLITKCVDIIQKELSKTIIIVARYIDNMIELMRAFRRQKIKFNLVDDGSSYNARIEFSGDLIKVCNLTTIPLETKYDMYVKAHESAKIIFTTYKMAIGGLQFCRRKFDYCIAFECDKVELFLGLGPMFISDKHILIDVREESQDDKEPANQEVDRDLTLGDHLRTDMVQIR